MITGTYNPITWTPTTELFTDNGATATYTGTNLPTVYAKPTATRTYTATATYGSCTSTATSAITVKAIPTNINPTAQSVLVCPNTATNIQITNSETGVNYQLRNN